MTTSGLTPETFDTLIAKMRKASTAVYLATDEAIADDLSSMLSASAGAIEWQGTELVRLRSENEELTHRLNREVGLKAEARIDRDEARDKIAAALADIDLDYLDAKPHKALGVVQSVHTALSGETAEPELEAPDQYQAACGSWNCLAPECRPKGL